MAKQSSILPEAIVAAGFKLKKDAPAKFYDRQFGEVNFAELSPDQAADLVSAGNEYLEGPGKKNISAES